jgi:solute carrier family 25 protein 39/40
MDPSPNPTYALALPLKLILPSSCGAVITALLMTPLDVVKIRLQAQNRLIHKGDCFVYRNGLMDHLCECFNDKDVWYNRKIPGGRYHGTLDAVAKIVKAEGVTSLWSGLPPTLLMAIPQTVFYFTTYEQTKRLLGYHEITNPNQVLPILSGGFARFLAVTVVSPLELIRTKIQSEHLKYTQIAVSVRQSIKSEGLRSLYRGWVPTILRDVPFSMVYWLCYESMKTYLLNRPNLSDSNNGEKKNSDHLSNITTFMCGATAGGVAAGLTCPLDVVKTHRQVQLGDEKDASKGSQKTFQIIKSIYRTKGVRGLFSGKFLLIFDFVIFLQV